MILFHIDGGCRRISGRRVWNLLSPGDHSRKGLPTCLPLTLLFPCSFQGRFKAITTIVNFSEVNVPSMLSGYNSKVGFDCRN